MSDPIENVLSTSSNWPTTWEQVTQWPSAVTAKAVPEPSDKNRIDFSRVCLQYRTWLHHSLVTVGQRQLQRHIVGDWLRPIIDQRLLQRDGIITMNTL